MIAIFFKKLIAYLKSNHCTAKMKKLRLQKWITKKVNFQKKLFSKTHISVFSNSRAFQKLSILIQGNGREGKKKEGINVLVIKEQ